MCVTGGVPLILLIFDLAMDDLLDAIDALSMLGTEPGRDEGPTTDIRCAAAESPLRLKSTVSLLATKGMSDEGRSRSSAE